MSAGTLAVVAALWTLGVAAWAVAAFGLFSEVESDRDAWQTFAALSALIFFGFFVVLMGASLL